MSTTPRSEPGVQVAEVRPRVGRKRDPTRDGVILDSTVAVLAEYGDEGMTIDLVAAHAGMARATVYRRWATKAELVLDAVDHLSQNDVSLESLPDTGTLRSDMMAMIRPFGHGEQQTRIQAVVGLLLLTRRTSGSPPSRPARALPRGSRGTASSCSERLTVASIHRRLT